LELFIWLLDHSSWLMIHSWVMDHSPFVMLSDSETSIRLTGAAYKILRFAQDDKMVFCPLVYFATGSRRTDKTKTPLRKL